MKSIKPFLVAEISANHCGKLTLAKKLIKSAKLNGADAVKLQTYTPDTMTIKSNKKYFKIKSGLWKGWNLWDLYNKAKTPLNWHKELFDYAKKIGITIFSTPFDESSVDFLEKLNCPIYKVASFEMNDISLIKKIALTKKPIIISTGMATLNEIKRAYTTAKKYGSKRITLLYCVSNYPSKQSDFNLNNIKILKKKFKCQIGLSDHSNDSDVAVAAIACGAEIIEKHIALKNQKKGLDLKFSLKGDEIKNFKKKISSAYNLVRNYKYYKTSDDKYNKIFRRSIFIIKNIKKGERFTPDNIKRIRPGYGLEPRYYEKIIGKKAKKNYFKAEPLNSF